MKMQIWKVYVTEGVMGAIHGSYYPIYEGFVPELKLTINQVTTFVGKDCSRYEHDPEHQMVKTPPPEMITEFELSRTQIEDAKTLATEDNPEDRMRQIVASALKERNLDTSDYDYDYDYEDEDEDEDEQAWEDDDK